MKLNHTLFFLGKNNSYHWSIVLPFRLNIGDDLSTEFFTEHCQLHIGNYDMWCEDTECKMNLKVERVTFCFPDRPEIMLILSDV